MPLLLETRLIIRGQTTCDWFLIYGKNRQILIPLSFITKHKSGIKIEQDFLQINLVFTLSQKHVVLIKVL